MTLVGAILLVAATVYFILHPIVKGRFASLRREDDEMTESEARRRVTLLALRDVEYDFATGKLDESDYGELKRELSAEALAALDAASDEGSAVDQAAIEREIAAVREGLREGYLCGACGHRSPDASRYCANCGVRLDEGRTQEATTSP